MSLVLQKNKFHLKFLSDNDGPPYSCYVKSNCWCANSCLPGISLCFFFHCAAHRLNLVLSHSAFSIPAVKVVFANVSSFSTLTAHSSKRKDMFKSHHIEIPHPSETRWYYRSTIISIIYDKYNNLLEVLEDIVQNPHDWDDPALSKASDLLLHLNGFLFCFLLTVFNTIFDHSSILFNVLQNRTTDFSYGKQNINNFLGFMTSLRTNDAFAETYSQAVSMVGQARLVGIITSNCTSKLLITLSLC